MSQTLTIPPKTLNRRRRPVVTFMLLVVGIGLANGLVASLLPEQIDLTHKRVFTLSPMTQNLLTHLAAPVEITILASREPRTAGDRTFAQAALMFRELADSYRRLQPRIVVRELDPLSNTEARQLLQRYPDVVPPCVLIRLNKDGSAGHEVLQGRDLAEFQNAGPDRLPVVEFFGEQALTAALVRLTGGHKQTIVYVLTGHGELALDDDEPESRRGMGILAARWRELDIDLRPLDLRSVERVPADADIVLVPGGDQPLSAGEIDALRRYWTHGGRGLALCDLNYDSHLGKVVATGMEHLLAEFGVRLGNDRVIARGVTGLIDAAAPALPAVGEHPLVRSLSQASVLLYECRSVRPLLDVSPSALQAVPLLVSAPAPQAWAEGDLGTDREPEPDGPNDLPGPVAMAVAVERRQGDLNEPVLVVVGDAEFIENRALSDPTGRSGESFLLASLNWLRGRRDLLGDIPPRRNEGYRLPGTADEQRGLVWKSTLFLSALILSAGATVWVSRRDG
ncbi:MAG TPA: GldG family protein [Planctomycetaceae bacterium]|nr:GldG family protein [Planctomycetaceae bacterium]